MDYLLQGISRAWQLLFSLDQEVYKIVELSLKVSLLATLFASLVGIPTGFVIASRNFKGKSFLIIIVNTLMGLPTVIVGLLGYILLSRDSVFGFLDLLFTPQAIIIGEFFLSLPIITALTISAIQAVDPRVAITARTLGAGKILTFWTILMEARFSLLAAIIAGFSRAIAEVGCAMMLGGNIRFYTRTMTTAIALETGKGEFGFALALGFFLLAVIFSINIFFHFLQAKGKMV